jgi:hypothetical protein
MFRSDQVFRRERRVIFTTRAPLTISPGSSDPIEDATTIDISESGVRIRLRRPIEPGQVVELFFSKRPERCQVIWTKVDQSTRDLIAGLKFISPLPERGRPRPVPSTGSEAAN